MFCTFNISLNLTRWINNNPTCWSAKSTRINVQVTWGLQEALFLSVQKTPGTWNAPNTLDSARVEQVGVRGQRSSWSHILFTPRDWNYSRSGPSGLRNALVLTCKTDKELTICHFHAVILSPPHTVGHQNIISNNLTPTYNHITPISIVSVCITKTCVTWVRSVFTI